VLLSKSVEIDLTWGSYLCGVKCQQSMGQCTGDPMRTPSTIDHHDDFSRMNRLKSPSSSTDADMGTPAMTFIVHFLSSVN
jgi:hypothetical protein